MPQEIPITDSDIAHATNCQSCNGQLLPVPHCIENIKSCIRCGIIYGPGFKRAPDIIRLACDERKRAAALAEQVKKTWNPPEYAGGETKAQIAQTAVMQTIAYVMGKETLGRMTMIQSKVIDQGIALMTKGLDAPDKKQLPPDPPKPDSDSNSAIKGSNGGTVSNQDNPRSNDPAAVLDAFQTQHPHRSFQLVRRVNQATVFGVCDTDSRLVVAMFDQYEPLSMQQLLDRCDQTSEQITDHWTPI